MEHFYIRIGGEALCFSATHFITFNSDVCETAHGHDYCLSATITGELGPHRYIADFTAVRAMIEQLVARLNHRVLLPTASSTIRIVESATEVEVSMRERRWIFPRGDCVLLPLVNTTAEELARYLGEQIRDAIGALSAGSISQLDVELSESPGFAAGWRWTSSR